MDGFISNVESLQEEILCGILSDLGNNDVQKRSRGGILEEIKLYSKKIVRLALGNVGVRLLEFSENIDETHPELEDIFDGIFCPSNKLSVRLCEILRLCEWAVSQNMNEVYTCLKKSALFGLPKEIKSLQINQYVRFIKNSDLRKEIRNNRANQELYFNTNRIENLWNNTPNNFNFFIKNNKRYLKEINAAENQAQRYEFLGCLENAQVIRKEIEKFKNRFQDNCFGFHRITVMESAVILAKIHGARLKQENDCFCVDVEEICHDDTEYRTCVCSSGLMPNNENMQKVVSYLDNSPELGGKPMFDNYLVVYPNLDVQEKIFPVLLGEKDGRCYFISFWI
jgi:hypothetical protein